MCGILATRFEHTLPDVLEERGRDASRSIERSGVHLSHCLHRTVGDVAQPLEGNGVFAANCEVYNWRELARAHGIEAGNDAQLVFALLERLPDDVFTKSCNDSMIDPRLAQLLHEWSGSYAFVYVRAGRLIALRDPLGIRPLLYAEDAIASSHEALHAIDRVGAELHPRRMRWWNLEDGSQGDAYVPPVFPCEPRAFDDALEAAVIERLPEDDPVFVLLSGGVDSSLVTAIAAAHREVVGVTVSVEGPEASDHAAAMKVAEALDIDVLDVIVPPGEVPDAALDIARAIGEPQALKVSSALATYFAARAVCEAGGRVLLSGFGADEVLVSYARAAENYASLAESWSHLLRLWESNCLKEDAAAMRHTVEVRYPYLDREVISAGWRTIGTDVQETKPAVRDALRARGLDVVADREKKASQYGSNLDRAFTRHVKSLGVSKSRFLESAAAGKRLGVLISGGKDSLYAAYLLERFRYRLACALSVASKNPDSFMYHTPTSKLLPVIADRLGLPLVLEETEGERESELDALRRALRDATLTHGIVGIGCGAIKSNYQRDRLLLLCEEYGLSLYAPLWQFDELTYARQLEEHGFSVIITRVSAEGLDASDIGRVFSAEWAAGLAERSISPVGEGGEFETLVLECPLYREPMSVMLDGVEKDGLDVTGRFSLTDDTSGA